MLLIFLLLCLIVAGAFGSVWGWGWRLAAGLGLFVVGCALFALAVGISLARENRRSAEQRAQKSSDANEPSNQPKG